MRAQHKAHPAEVMAYAAKHGHEDIFDLAAPFSRGLPFAQVHTLLPPAYYTAWTLYYDEFRRAINSVTAIAYPTFHIKTCSSSGGPAIFVSRSHALQIDILDALVSEVTLDTVFEDVLRATASCPYCLDVFQTWKNDLSAALAAIPPFTTYLTK